MNASTGPNDIFVDPMMRTDYSLQEGSPCIDTGIKTYTINGLSQTVADIDILGDLPDRGAIEFAGSVVPANVAPTVIVGENLVVLAPTNQIMLVGEVSDDGLPESGSLATIWTLESGPTLENVIFSDATSATTNVTFSKQGVYELKLTANDGEKNSSDKITIFFVNDYNDTTIEIGESTFIEAEDYRYLAGSAQVLDFTGASEGEIVTAPLGGGTYAYSEYRLVTFSEGTYFVWINASGLNEGSNGLNVSFNDLEVEIAVEARVTNSFGDESWVLVVFENIPEGVYPLRISASEEGVKWDRMFITTDENKNPFETSPEVLKIYPVPNVGNFIIALKSTEPTKIEVFNIQGQLVYTTEVSNTLFASMDLGVFGKGVYVVSISNKMDSSSKKIIIK